MKDDLDQVLLGFVVIEGNSFSNFVRPDYFLMVKDADSNVIKKTARAVFNMATALYPSDLETNASGEIRVVRNGETLPVFTAATLPVLIQQLQKRGTILAA